MSYTGKTIFFMTLVAIRLKPWNSNIAKPVLPYFVTTEHFLRINTQIFFTENDR